MRYNVNKKIKHVAFSDGQCNITRYVDKSIEQEGV